MFKHLFVERKKMNFNKTRIHCPCCGTEYEIDPELYKKRELVICSCSRKWRADEELEQMSCELIPAYSSWHEFLFFLLLIILPGIVSIVLFFVYRSRLKRMKNKFDRLRKEIRLWSDAPILRQNMHIFIKNIKEVNSRMNCALAAVIMGYSITFCIYSAF